MKQGIIDLIQSWVNATNDVDQIAKFTGMSIERLAQVAGPEVAAVICEESAKLLHEQGTLK